MKSNFKYPVTLIKQIPYFSNLVKGVLSVCFIICIITWFIYFPSADSGNEMQTVAIVTSTPDPSKWLVLFSTIALVPLFYLYEKVRIRKPAFLIFNDDNIV